MKFGIYFKNKRDWSEKGRYEYAARHFDGLCERIALFEKLKEESDLTAKMIEIHAGRVQKSQIASV